MDKVTPQDVVKAITDCFYEAHCADTGLEESELTGRQYCLAMVKKIFKDQEVDFNNPTKDGIFKVVNALAEFSKGFRSQDTITAHKKEIIELLSKMD
jgi:hypothetical protein